MSKSIYRKDISHQEIKTIVNFSYGLTQLINDPYLRWGKVLNLGKTDMLLPLWYKSWIGWQLSSHRIFVREAIGIEKHAMNRLARYLGIRTRDLVQLLYKFSMLAVDPLDNKTVLQSYTGMLSGSDFEETGYGYVVEKRRALNGFSQTDGRQPGRQSDSSQAEVGSGY